MRRVPAPERLHGQASRAAASPARTVWPSTRAGRLHICQHGDRRIARLAADGKTFETLADRFDGKRFNSPNDLVVRANGDVYFTDPLYGLEGHEKDPAREIPWSGVYRARAGGGVDVLDKTLSFPNGLAFSPDGKTLYVAMSDPARAFWMAYDVDARASSPTGACSSTRRRS